MCTAKYKVKVKFSLWSFLPEHHVMKVCWGVEVWLHAILTLPPGIRWKWVVSSTTRPLYPQGKSPWYPLDRRLGEHQNWYGHDDEKENSQPLTGNWTPDHLVLTEMLHHWAIPTPTELNVIDSSVGIALGYGLDDRGSRVRFPAVAGNFSLHRRVQNGSGAHPAS
jgi:hypothetical protein